jgi:hypothetical protein
MIRLVRRLVIASTLLFAACTAPLTGGANNATTHTPPGAPIAPSGSPAPSESGTQTEGPSPGSELHFRGESGDRQIKIEHLAAGNYDVAWQASGSCSFSMSLSSSDNDNNSNQNTGTSGNGHSSGHTVVATNPQQAYVLRIIAAGQNGLCSWTVTVKRI